MKVLFVFSGIAAIGFDSYNENMDDEDYNRFVYPFGICYLASSIAKAGHEPSLLDLRRLKGFDEVKEKIASSNADVIALSFQSPDRDFGFRTAQIAKELGKRVIVGGLHASLQSNDCLDSGFFDTVFTGPGELALVQYLATIENGNIPDRLIIGRNPNDLDTLPFPHLFPEVEEVYKKTKRASVLISRGCYGKCNYCYPAPEKAFGKTIKMRTIGNVRDEIALYRDKYGVNEILILDDLFLSNKKKTAEFAEMLKEFEGLEIILSTRAELLNETNVAQLKDHLMIVSIGFESGSQKMLDLINKKTTVEDNYNAGRLLNRHGIGFLANLLNCIPGQTREDYDLTIKMLEDLKPEMIYFNCFSPLPGTVLHDHCIKNKLLPEQFPYEWYECRNVLKERLIKGVDYDLWYEYSEHIGRLLTSPHTLRDYRKIVKNPNNLDTINYLNKMENQNVFILRSGPKHLLDPLLKMLEETIPPGKITILSTQGLQETEYDKNDLRLINEKWMSLESIRSDKELFLDITGRKFGASFILYGDMQRDSYEEPNKISSSITAEKHFELGKLFEIKTAEKN